MNLYIFYTIALIFFCLPRRLLVTCAGYKTVVLLFTRHIQFMCLMPKYFHCLRCATISKDSPSTSRCAKESKQTDPKSIYIKLTMQICFCCMDGATWQLPSSPVQSAWPRRSRHPRGAAVVVAAAGTPASATVAAAADFGCVERSVDRKIRRRWELRSSPVRRFVVVAVGGQCSARRHSRRAAGVRVRLLRPRHLGSPSRRSALAANCWQCTEPEEKRWRGETMWGRRATAWD